MGKKEVIVLALGVFALFFWVSSYLTFHVFDVNFFPVSISGYAVNGLVDLYVNGSPRYVEIDNPQNITYYFDKGELYIVPLNVSASFNVAEWKYDHYDLRHTDIYQTEIPLSTPNPNGTLTAYRWGNRLVVSAREVDGNWYSEEVYFYVEVPNSNPIIEPFDTNLFACEGQRLSHYFNSSDVDEQRGTPELTPSEQIFVAVDREMIGLNITSHQIISGVLSKANAGGVNAGSKLYQRTLIVRDNYNETHGIDSEDVNITVIEINNPPALSNVLTQTVWTSGDDSVFEYQLQVEDAELGYAQDGNLNFTIDFNGIEPLFDVNDTGYMYFEPTEFDIDTYAITVCVQDDEITNPHENISLCAPSNYTAVKACDNFDLTVTDVNRAPEIIAVPIMEEVGGDKDLTFWATVHDPDGTTPDVFWFVDGILNEVEEGASNDTFIVHFACEVFGDHNVTVVATDGALNTSYTWNLSVSLVACPPGIEPGSGGGGGGGGGIAGTTTVCDEEWSCTTWSTCRNAERAFLSKLISPEDYVFYQEACEANNNSDERFCGFQVTSCRDLNLCNNSDPRVDRPEQVRYCYFTENPSCNDGITNCHHGDCEVLVDCGGPCQKCPTCSDGIQNGGEHGVDCGGPCPYLCPPEEPLPANKVLMILLGIVLFFIFIFIGWKVIKIFIYRRRLEEGRKREWRGR